MRLALFGGMDCSGPQVGAGTADVAGFFNIPIERALEANRTTSLSAYALDAPARCSSPLLYTVDRAAPPPAQAVALEPPSPTAASRMRVRGQAGEPNVQVLARNDALCGGIVVASTSADATGAFVLELALERGGTRALCLESVDAAGNHALHPCAFGYTQLSSPPAAPQRLRAVPSGRGDPGSGEALLHWNPPADVSMLDHYELIVCPGVESCGEGTAPVTSFAAASLSDAPTAALDPGQSAGLAPAPAVWTRCGFTDSSGSGAHVDLRDGDPVTLAGRVVGTEQFVVPVRRYTLKGLAPCTPRTVLLRAVDRAGQRGAVARTVAQGAGDAPPPKLSAVVNGATAEIRIEPLPASSGSLAPTFELCTHDDLPACAGEVRSMGGRLSDELRGLSAGTTVFGVRAVAAGCPGVTREEERLPRDAQVDASARLLGAGSYDRFGAAIARAGDLDGDGVDDVLVGIPGAQAPPGAPSGAEVPASSGATGAVRAVSGATGATLWEWYGTRVGEGLGTLIQRARDSAGEPTTGWLVGAPGSAGVGASPVSGRIVPLRVTDGGISASLPIEYADLPALGTEFDSLGDVDGDGLPDLVAGAWSLPSPFSVLGSGAAFVVSSRTGGRTHEVRGSTPTWAWGLVATLGDVDGDGVTDYALGRKTYAGIDGYDGQVVVYSGASGAALYTIELTPVSPGALPVEELGVALAAVGDADGDGIPDLVIVSRHVPEDGGPRLQVAVHSGATGERLWAVLTSISEGGTFFAGPAGDADDDGRADVMLLRHEADGTRVVSIHAGSDGAVLYRCPSDGVLTGLWVGDTNGDGRPDWALGAPLGRFGESVGRGTVDQCRPHGGVGIVPSESVDPLWRDGYGSVNVPEVRPGEERTFRVPIEPVRAGGIPSLSSVRAWFLPPAGGNGPSRAGSTVTVEPSPVTSGVLLHLRAGATANVYETLRVVDPQLRSRDTRVFIGAPGAPRPALPRRPVRLTARPLGGGLRLTWADTRTPGQGRAETYSVELRLPTMEWATLAEKLQSPAFDTGVLPSGNRYYVRVRVVGATGDSAWSPVTQIALPP